ncbi:MAG: hypothetical protein MUC74_11550 [Ideonella sp.]|jgi:hypothetical protein|nr:hypothetical protein [Ideonella sp.]
MLGGLKRLLGLAPAPAPVAPRPRVQRPVAQDFAMRPPGPHLRSPLRPEDETLSRPAIEWLKALPRRHRPEALARQYPRICNKFALVWPDPALTEAYFDALLVDRRGGRRGFPRDVLTDILQLNEYFVQQQSGGAYRSLVDGVSQDSWAGSGRL